MLENRREDILSKVAMKQTTMGFMNKKILDRVADGARGGAKFSKDIAPLIAMLGSMGTGAASAAKGLKSLKEMRRLKKMSPTKRALHKAFAKGTPGRKALGYGAAASGIAGGIKGIDVLSDRVGSKIHKKSSFKNMMDENPGLKKEDSRAVSRIFRTLHKFNPKMAGDPLVAGSFLKRSLQFKDEGIQPVDIKTLADIRKAQSQSKGDSILRGAFVRDAAGLAAFA